MSASRSRNLAISFACAAALAGCMVGPIQDNPTFIPLDPTVIVENPIWVPFGHEAYGTVFEKVLDIVDDYFDIRYANRYDGHIVTFGQGSSFSSTHASAGSSGRGAIHVANKDHSPSWLAHSLFSLMFRRSSSRFSPLVALR